MKKCKYCQSEIDKKAKICPNCRKSQSSSALRIFIGVILGLIIIIAIVTGGNNTTSEENFTYEVVKQYADEYGFSYYIEGTVKNNKSKEYAYVQIEFVCYDSEGNNLGTAIDNTNNLLGNETWKFKAIGLFTDQKVDHCDYKETTGW